MLVLVSIYWIENARAIPIVIGSYSFTKKSEIVNCKSIGFKNGVYCTILQKRQTIAPHNGNHNNINDEKWVHNQWNKWIASHTAHLTYTSSIVYIFGVHRFVQNTTTAPCRIYFVLFLASAKPNIEWQHCINMHKYK